MASDENKRNRIMDYAFKKFTTEGVSQVTMDDLARGVGMGKGTLYKFFPSKEALMSSTVEFFASRLEKSVEAVLSDEKLTSVEKLSLFLKIVAEKLSKLNPSALSYIERNMPEMFEKIEKTRERIIMKNLVRLFSEGKMSGLFDSQMDEVFVVQIMIGAINHIIQPHVMATLNYSIDRLFTSITSTLLKGCLSQEGRKLAYPEKSS